jgi:hypothetical protein
MAVTGRVTEVVTEPTSTGVRDDTAAGGAILLVDSVAAFPETGGTIVLTDADSDGDQVTEEIDYTAVDMEAQSLILDGTTVNAYSEGTTVTLTVPDQPTTTAYVATNNNQEDMSAFVPQELKAVYATALEDGTRDPGTGVPVVVAEVYGRWTVVSVQAAPSVASETLTGPVPEDLLPDIPTASDGNPPTESPVVTARSIPGFAQLTWEEPANPDVLIGYRVYVGTDSAMAANSTTQHSVVGGTLALIRTLPDGTAMTPGTTYWFRVAAEDFDDVGPASAAVSAQVGFQSTPDIATASVTASMLQSVLVLASQFIGKAPPLVVVNKQLTSNVATLTTELSHGLETGARVNVTGVDATFNGSYIITSTPTPTTFTYARTAADVASTAVVGGLADPSQRWEADADGIRFYDHAGIPVIDLPTNSSPDNPASFYGSMVAVGLQVLDNLSVTGDNNELAAGSTFTLKSGVTKPSLPPTATPTYKEMPSFEVGALPRAWTGVWDYDDGYWWLIWLDDEPVTNVMYLAQFDPAGGEPIDVTELPQQYDEYPKSLVKIGDHVYSYVDDDGGRILYWNLASLVNGLEVDSDDVRIGHDYVDNRVVRTILTGTTVHTTTRDPATFAEVDLHSRTSTNWTRMDKTAADFGSAKFIQYNQSDGKVHVLSTAPIQVLDNDRTFDAWQYEYLKGGLPAWDGTQFISRANPYANTTTVRLRGYSNITWAAADSAKWWIGATWRDSDATSPDFAAFETDLGPKTAITMKKRAYLSMSMPSIPAAPVDAVTFYVGRGATEPAGTAMWRQSPPAAGVANQELLTAVLTGTSPIDNPPTVNGFPGGSPSVLDTQEGGFALDSEGHVTAPMKMQSGVAPSVPIGVLTAVVFPVEFDAEPIVTLTSAASANQERTLIARNITTTGFDIYQACSTSATARSVNWIAVVP